MSDVLGATTGTFDHDGEMKAGALSSSLSGGHISLKFPRVSFEYSKRVADGTAFDASMGGGKAIYSASIAVSASVQDYDLQSIISSSAVNDTGSLYYNKV